MFDFVVIGEVYDIVIRNTGQDKWNNVKWN